VELERLTFDDESLFKMGFCVSLDWIRLNSDMPELELTGAGWGFLTGGALREYNWSNWRGSGRFDG